VREIAEGVAALHGGHVRLTYTRGYPVTKNHAGQTAFAQEIASEIAGKDRVNGELPPMMGAEDFSYMLNARPGAFIFVGNGENSAGLHHPAYDFNDEIIPLGSSYWVRLVEKALAG
jgi:hippurate hydrolase